MGRPIAGTADLLYFVTGRSPVDPLRNYELESVPTNFAVSYLSQIGFKFDRLCGLVVRVLGYRSGGPGSINGTTKKKVVGLERGPLSLMSTTEELLERKVAAPV
jgi:hypothetical protein